MYQGLPILQEGSAEEQDVGSVLPIVRGQVEPALREEVGQALGVQSVGGDHVGRAIGPAETLDQFAHLAGERIVQEKKRVGLPLLVQPSQVVCHLGDGFLPGNRFPAALPPLSHAPEGVLYPVGVVEHLESGLGSGAGLALVERMEGVTLDLDRQPSHDPRPQATLSRTQLAHAGHPHFFAGRSRLVNQAQGAQNGAAGFIQSCSSRAHSGQFDKFTPVNNSHNSKM